MVSSLNRLELLVDNGVKKFLKSELFKQHFECSNEKIDSEGILVMQMGADAKYHNLLAF